MHKSRHFLSSAKKREKARNIFSKKFEKISKNLLTKWFEGDIIYKLSQRVEANRNLTTEQQIKEVQSKKASANTKSVKTKENTTLKK